MRDYTTIRATTEHADTILALQRLAYRTEAERYDDWGMPPLTQTIDEIRGQFDDHVFLATLASGGQLVGSVRATRSGATCLIGRLIVHPDHRRRGIAADLMARIESEFANVERYELFTGHRSEPALGLYRKRGFVVFREEAVNDRVTLVFMEKRHRPDA